MAKKRFKSFVTICNRELVDLITFKRGRIRGWSREEAKAGRKRYPASAKCKTRTFLSSAIDGPDWNRALSKAIKGLVKH